MKMHDKDKEEQRREKYDALFPNDRIKAEAFDQIAERYYFGNFGTMQKSDLEVLLFSIYLERILEQSEKDEKTYSDYTLSKDLGITQSRVSQLKVKKQLKHPYERFDWKKSFKRIMGNAQYENGKIKIHIPDRNLFLELQNAVEESGGFIDVQLNSKLLQISPAFFLDLLMLICDETEKEEVRTKILEKIRENDDIKTYFAEDALNEKAGLEKKSEDISFGRKLKNCSRKVVEAAIPEILACYTPVVGPVVKVIIDEMKAAN